MIRTFTASFDWNGCKCGASRWATSEREAVAMLEADHPGLTNLRIYASGMPGAYSLAK